MPILVTFDIQSPTPMELNRIRGGFERLNWEHLGNTAYRYPRLNHTDRPEDWFNHALPALMLLRSYSVHLLSTGRRLHTFSIDVQSSSGRSHTTDTGAPPLPAEDILFLRPSRSGEACGRRNLIDWIDSITWPYPTTDT